MVLLLQKARSIFRDIIDKEYIVIIKQSNVDDVSPIPLSGYN